MALYQIRPERQTLHGAFNRDLPPVLTIASGDTVHFQTLDAGWNIGRRTSPVPEERPAKFTPRDPERDAGHALCGPIAIAGAEPGMTLAVHINTIRPASWGWTTAGGWESRINTRLGLGANVPEQMLLWELDTATMQGRNQFGDTVPLHPFMGVLGMPPDQPGWHSTTPPRPQGGNLDCKELVAGSTLYLPIAVSGALFSVGDGHALQADGEVSSTAIECAMELVDLTFELVPDLQLTLSRANTPAGWLTMGFNEDLHEASMLALVSMLEVMQAHYQLDRHRALALASLVVDLHITQLVNGGILGVHALLPHGILNRATSSSS